MLDFSRTRIQASEELPVHPLYPITAEGQAVQHIFNGSIGCVCPSTGVANSIFVGFSMAQNISETTAVYVETQYVPTSAPYTITLSQTPDATADLLVIDSNALVYAFNASVGAGQYNLVGAVVTVPAAAAGLAVNFTYRYALTVAQQQALYGSQPIGQTAASIVNAVGVIKSGDVYTSLFDTSANWAAASLSTSVLTAGANGRIYIGGTGAVLGGNARVIGLPTSDYPFLGIRVNL